MDHLRNEEHVQQAIQNRHVDGDEQDNGLQKQKLKRSEKDNTQLLTKWQGIDLCFGNIFWVVLGLPEFLCAALQNSRCVGLRNGECDQAPCHTGQDQLQPVEPSPTASITQKTTGKRTNRRT